MTAFLLYNCIYLFKLLHRKAEALESHAVCHVLVLVGEIGAYY